MINGALFKGIGNQYDAALNKQHSPHNNNYYNLCMGMPFLLPYWMGAALNRKSVNIHYSRSWMELPATSASQNFATAPHTYHLHQLLLQRPFIRTPLTSAAFLCRGPADTLHSHQLLSCAATPHSHTTHISCFPVPRPRIHTPLTSAAFLCRDPAYTHHSHQLLSCAAAPHTHTTHISCFQRLFFPSRSIL